MVRLSNPGAATNTCGMPAQPWVLASGVIVEGVASVALAGGLAPGVWGRVAMGNGGKVGMTHENG